MPPCTATVIMNAKKQYERCVFVGLRENGKYMA